MFENQKLRKKLSEIEIKLTEQENWNDHLIFNELLGLLTSLRLKPKSGLEKKKIEKISRIN